MAQFLFLTVHEYRRDQQKAFYKDGYVLPCRQGISSKLLKFENGIIYIELEVRGKWSRSLDAAAWTIAHSWRTENTEFEEAIASKVYIIDSRSYEYKRTLMHLGVKPGYDAYKGVFFK